jgi:single-stranded DNA-specific DHH superfamily exonuclease
MNVLKPFGQKFPKPLFSVEGQVFNLKPLGKLAKIHLSFQLQTQNGPIRCIWFNARASEDAPFPIENSEYHLFCAEASINRFNNNANPQLMIVATGEKSL